MSRYLIGCAGALLVSATVAAQNPPTQQDPPTTRPPMAQQESARAVTVEGCLVREADVPGRKPNVAERAGIAEDYILTSTKMIKGSAPAGAGQYKPGTPTGTSGAREPMYEVEGIDDEELKQHVGQRVQIEGTFENVDRARATPEGQTPADDLVEIRGTVIRKVPGDCPPK